MATPYSFTQPIRYYKANDPYYYEIDNLPLRQLEENILFIKGMLEGSAGSGGGGGQTYLTNVSELDITNVKQLRPKATGQDRLVSVNAGRFVSRINDAFNVQYPLNKLITSSNPSIPPLALANLLQTPDTLSFDRDQVWNAFVNGASNPSPLNMNGLTHTYTFHLTPGSQGASYGVWGVPTGNSGDPGQYYPRYQGVEQTESQSWPYVGHGNVFANKLGSHFFNAENDVVQTSMDDYAAEDLAAIHLAFVQMWRGVFRTSVVDFPDVSIEIPEWEDLDYRYTDGGGAQTPISGANQRIDLLVAYSLPIDQKNTTVSNYEDTYTTGPSTPKTLTAPTLGLVKGAGVGIVKATNTFESISTEDTSDIQGGGTQPSEGASKIVANIGDTAATANQGITDRNGNKVHGSFPSPDDLLNLAPLLALDVEDDNLNLVGQAALPLAYVVVHKGQTNITQNDIIDIRPFLRTTEFTYNERAGIAGANPPLSLANPAVGAWQLQQTLRTQGVGEGIGENNSGKAIYTDYVMGGLAFGVEGTLMTMRDGQVQDAQDPFGANTVQQTAYSAGNGITYDFSVYNSSRAYLDDSVINRRQAFLEYVYNERQSDLKYWLANPNLSYSQQTTTYLGLPPNNTGGRNIPLYPEWDMPMGSSEQYNTVVGNTATAPVTDSPQCTWWMWFEAVNQHRTLSYVPGGVVSNRDSGGENWLEKSYGFGYGEDGLGQAQIAGGTLSVVTKELKVNFPSWVVDYDVLVEYVNCSPVADSNNGGNESDTFDGGPTGVNQTIGLGGGVYVNKGALQTVQGTKQAKFRINSAANNIPEAADGLIGGGSTTTGGAISDVQHTGPSDGASRESKISNTRLWQYLSYSVCVPGYIQTHYNAEGQNAGTATTTRLMPKFGASYYPTVKFTIIAYDSLSVDRNTAYNQNNNWTLIQNPANGSLNRLLIDPATGLSRAPFQLSPTVVNLHTQP